MTTADLSYVSIPYGTVLGVCTFIMLGRPTVQDMALRRTRFLLPPNAISFTRHDAESSLVVMNGGTELSAQRQEVFRPWRSERGYAISLITLTACFFVVCHLESTVILEGQIALGVDPLEVSKWVALAIAGKLVRFTEREAPKSAEDLKLIIQKLEHGN